MLSSESPLRVDHQPTIGQEVLLRMPVPEPSSASSTFSQQTRATYAVAEALQALKYDLWARSFEGRCTRLGWAIARLGRWCWARIEEGLMACGCKKKK